MGRQPLAHQNGTSRFPSRSVDSLSSASHTDTLVASRLSGAAGRLRDRRHVRQRFLRFEWLADRRVISTSDYSEISGLDLVEKLPSGYRRGVP